MCKHTFTMLLYVNGFCNADDAEIKRASFHTCKYFTSET